MLLMLRTVLIAVLTAALSHTPGHGLVEGRLEKRPNCPSRPLGPMKLAGPRLHSAFFSRDPQKLVGHAKLPETSEQNLPTRVLFAPLENSNVRKAVAVAGTTALASALCYAYIKRLLWHHLYGKYIRKDAPGISSVLGHVLYTKDDHHRVGSRSRTVFDIIRAIFLPLFERCSWIRGILKLNIHRIPIGEAIEEGSVTALYFHSNNVQKMLKEKGYKDFTSNLMRIQESVQASGRKFQVVYVNVDQKQVDGVDHFKDMPWYALPFDDKSRISHLCQLYDITGIPSVVLVNSDGSVINDRALYHMAHRPNDFPWKIESALDLLPDTLINGNNQMVPKSALDGKIVGLYFGAGWTKSSKDFSEKLQEYHRAVNEKTDGRFEVVYVSNDKTEDDFEKELYDSNGNWLSIPYQDSDSRMLLQQFLKVPLMPALILLDPSGNVITPDGRFYVEADRGANALPYESYLQRSGRQFVEDVSVNVDAFAHQPVVILFMDDVSGEDQSELLLQLSKAAEGHGSTRKGRELKFFVSRVKDKRNDAVRTICGCERNSKPQVVILDLLTQKVHYDPKMNAIDKDSILAMIDQFYEGKLKTRGITMPT